jgi:hypothetical protein
VVGSLDVGLQVLTGTPRFLLALRDVDVPGQHYDVLDLSTPEAAAAAAADAALAVVRAALDAALGAAAEHVEALIGLLPAGAGTIDGARLLTDPLGALGAWWHALLTAGGAAVTDVLGHLLASLSGPVAGPAAVGGTGTPADPWTLRLVPNRLDLRAWIADGTLLVAPVASVRSTDLAGGRPGHDHRRAVDLMRGDLDAFEEACDPVRPGWVKVQAAGPWTLVAGVELHSGHRVLTDRGAVREFATSLTEGLRQHVAEVASRTGAQVLLQLDEPTLPAVLAGSLSTPSGYGEVRVVAEPDAKDVLRQVIAGVGGPVVVHCCADRPPVRLLADIGAAGIGIDATLPGVAGRTAEVDRLDALGETWDAGTPLLLGLVPSTDPRRRVSDKSLARPALDLADRLGFARERLATLAVPTPTCGLAGASPDWARRALTLTREIATLFTDPPDDEA